MEKVKKISKGVLNFLAWNRWHFVTFCGLLLILICSKPIFAAEMYNYPDLTGESKTSFLKNIKTVNISINFRGYSFSYHCGGSWNKSDFTPSTSGKPHVLGSGVSSVHPQDKAPVIKFLYSECGN